MREVYAQLPEELRRVTLVQGSMPKGRDACAASRAVDHADRSVLFGLSTFAEGVDLPGGYCTHVVIAKLPFSVPDSPLEEARRGGSSRGVGRPLHRDHGAGGRAAEAGPGAAASHDP